MRDPQIAPPRLHAAFAAIGVAFLAIFSWVFLREQGAEWRAAQQQFQALQATVKDPHQLAQSASVGGLRQFWLPDLDRIDRCTTCHLGIDDPAFIRAAQPFTTHPGTWLTTHPVERFGCTICHDGQGDATTYRDAAHHPVAFIERPMRPVETIEANCGRCHRSIDAPDAPALSDGRRLIRDSGCMSCHEIPGFEGLTFNGPRLDSFGYKVRPEWLGAWLAKPKDYLPHSKMGNFRLSAQEIDGLRPFLLSQRAQAPVDRTGIDWKKADPAAGRALFGELRCVSCHSVNGRGGDMGPELTRIGDKVGREWLFGFLKNPHREQPDTPMLEYRLSDTQLRDLTTFLLDEYRTSGGGPDQPPSSYQDPQAVAAGRATFIRRGCPSCHQLKDVPDHGRIGPSLAGVADRDPEQLQYGPTPVRHTTDNYVFLKILEPEALGQPSLMPTFDFQPEDAAKITLALASLRTSDLPASFVQRRPPVAPYRTAGAFGAWAGRYRCLSCHTIGGFGGTLSTVPLDRIGSQLQRNYLVDYLLHPGAVRVSVEARMPVFHMLPEEARTIADYASLVFLDDALDAYDARFTLADERRGQQLYAQLGCVGCHQIDTHGGYVGPDLSNSGTRLKPGWVAAWLKSPARYKPGTLQPDYGLSDADVRALTAYISSLGADGTGRPGGAR